MQLFKFMYKFNLVNQSGPGRCECEPPGTKSDGVPVKGTRCSTDGSFLSLPARRLLNTNETISGEPVDFYVLCSLPTPLTTTHFFFSFFLFFNELLNFFFNYRTT